MSDLPQSSPLGLTPPRRSAASAGEQMRASPRLIRALRDLHQPCSRTLAARLSAAVRSTAEVRLLHVDSLRYQAFDDRLGNPTCLCAIHVESTSERLLLEISPAILFPLLDRLLGGGHEPSPAVRRPLTEIEQRLAAHLAGIVMTELQSVWREASKSSLVLDRIFTDPQQVRDDWPSSERVVQIEFEVAVDDARGGMRVCLPLGLAAGLCPHAENLDEQDSLSSTGMSDVATGTEHCSSMVPLVAHLAESKLSASDVAGLRPGDIITTAHSIDSPLLIRVDGVAQFHARPGALEGRKAAQIEGLIDPPAK